VLVVAALLALFGCVTIGATVPGMFWLVIVGGLVFELAAALWFVATTGARTQARDRSAPFRLPQEAGAGATSRIA
jgi:hypothetical protein